MMSKQLFNIGEVAKMFHLSVSTLRHYEHIGLLKPEYISPESGYRYYGTKQFEILNTIRYLRALDMPLNEITSFLNNKDIHVIEEKLNQQRKIVVKKQQELKRIEQKINHRLYWLKDAKNQPLDTISMIELPCSRLVWLDYPQKIEGLLDIETSIRQLDQSDKEAVIFLGKVGLGISKENLLAKKYDQYDGVFLVLDQEDVYEGKMMHLPKMQCVRIRFCGSHQEAKKQYEKLIEYIEKNHLNITGFSRETTLIDYGITNNRDEFVTEICIPVRRKEQ